MTPLRRRRLLFIGAVPPPYHGVSGVNDILLRSPLLAANFDIRHLDISDRRSISTVEQFDWQNVWLALKHGVQCLRHLLFWRPDIVYVPISQKTLGFLRDALFLVPCRILGRGVVVHLHGGDFQEFYRATSRPLRALIRFCLKRVRTAIVLGECLRSCFEGLVPADRIVVVPNGIPDFARGRTNPSPNEQLRVLYLGTVVSEKGSHVFVRAALEALDKIDAVEFAVAGPWYRESEREELTSLVQAQGRSNNIHFLGAVTGDQKTEVLCSSDVLVFPGLQQEGLPLVVLEAMCAGLPVIASDRGCLREVVVEGITGFIVPPGDALAITKKLLALAANPIQCREMGVQARQRYDQKYREDRFAGRMIEVLERVCEGGACGILDSK